MRNPFGAAGLLGVPDRCSLATQLAVFITIFAGAKFSVATMRAIAGKYKQNNRNAPRIPGQKTGGLETRYTEHIRQPTIYLFSQHFLQ
jgi:hypothetical protein